MKVMPRWPVFLIAAPAAVAVWSGWVGLGGMCGFGMVHPLPGIVPGLQLDTAITLPVGVEAYGAYALGAWLTPGTPERARTFARRSAIGALALGMLGQVVYHLLAAAGAARAPWPVVVLVSCLPVVTLGFGAALAHLLRDTGAAAEAARAGGPVGLQATAESVSGPAPAGDPGPVLSPALLSAQAALEAGPGPEAGPVSGPARRRSSRRPAAATVKQPGPATAGRLREYYADSLAAGQVPSIRQIRREWPVGYARASELHAALVAGPLPSSPKTPGRGPLSGPVPVLNPEGA
jgi:hypothetical protein